MEAVRVCTVANAPHANSNFTKQENTARRVPTRPVSGTHHLGRVMVLYIDWNAGLCSMCGKKILDIRGYKQSAK